MRRKPRTVRWVYDGGQITFRDREYRVGKAFRGLPVALQSTECEGVLDVYLSTHRIAWIDKRTGRWGRPRRGGNQEELREASQEEGVENSPAACPKP